MGQQGGSNTAGGGYRVSLRMNYMGCELYPNKAIILKYQHNKRATLQRSQPAWEKAPVIMSTLRGVDSI